MFNSKFSLLFTAMIISSLSACDAVEEAEDNELASSTIDVDRIAEYRAFVNKATTEITKQKIESIYLLSSGSEFQSQFYEEEEEDSSSSEPEEETCLDRESAAGFQVKASGSIVSYSFSHTITEDCKAEMIEAEKDFFVTASDGDFTVSCTNNDVSALDGISESDLFKSLEDVCGNAIGVLYYYHHTYYDGPGFQQTESDVVEDYGLTATENGEICKFNLDGQNINLDSDCITVFYTAETFPEKREFSQHIMKGITGTIGPKWYATGTTEVTLNDWSGAVTYQGNESAPSFSISNGNETVEGTLAANHIERSTGLTRLNLKGRSITGVRTISK